MPNPSRSREIQQARDRQIPFGRNQELERASLTRNAGFRVAGFATGIVLTLVTTPLFLKGFGLEGFGIWSVAVAALGMTGMLDLGLGVTTVYFVAAAEEKGPRAHVRAVGQAGLLILLLMGSVGAFCLWLVAPWIVGHIDHSASDTVFLLTLQIAALAVLPVFGTNWAVNIFSALERYGMATVLRLVPLVTGLGGAALGAARGWPMEQAMAWNAGAILLGSIGSIILAVRALGFGTEWLSLPDSAVLKGMASYGGVVGIGGMAARVFNLLDRILVGVALSAGAAGIYTAAIGVANKLNSLTQNASQVLLPRMSALAVRGQRAGIRELFLTTHRLLACTVLLLGLILVAFAHELIDLWLGPDMAALMATPLRILGVIYALVGSAIPSMHVLNGIGRPWVYSTFMTIAAAGTLTFLVLFGSRGVNWAAGSNIAALVLIGMPVLATHLLSIPFRSLLRWYGLPVTVALGGWLGIVVGSGALTVAAGGWLGVAGLVAFQKLRLIETDA